MTKAISAIILMHLTSLMVTYFNFTATSFALKCFRLKVEREATKSPGNRTSFIKKAEYRVITDQCSVERGLSGQTVAAYCLFHRITEGKRSEWSYTTAMCSGTPLLRGSCYLQMLQEFHEFMSFQV